jgi:hypothetical protein
MSPQYDATIVGGGQDGLVAATGLARGWPPGRLLGPRDLLGSAPGHDTAEAIPLDPGGA